LPANRSAIAEQRRAETGTGDASDDRARWVYSQRRQRAE